MGKGVSNAAIVGALWVGVANDTLGLAPFTRWGYVHYSVNYL
jgi:hypothetical protein